jgi:hypothetical protein
MGDWQPGAIVRILVKHLFMKSIRFSLLALLAVLTMGAVAQEESASKFYVKAYGGYGLLTPGSYRLTTSTSSDTDPYSTLSVSKKSLGAGIRAGGGIGVIASDFLNIGVDVEYLSGAPVKIQSEYRSDSYWSSWSSELTYKSLSIVPHVVFKALSKPDYLIYNKLGILVNLPFDIDRSYSDTAANPAVPYHGKTVANGTYKIKLGAGLNVAFGVQVTLSEKLRGFGEIFGNYLILTPESFTETQVTTEDNGGPSSVSNTNLTLTYVKEGPMPTTSSSAPNTKGGYDYVYKYTYSVHEHRMNMNAIGINIGVTYRF